MRVLPRVEPRLCPRDQSRRGRGNRGLPDLLNPDARTEDDCVARMAAVAGSDPRIALVGAQILLEDGVTQKRRRQPSAPDRHLAGGRVRRGARGGRAARRGGRLGRLLLIRRAAFDDLGGFVEEFFLYYDDVDLAWRARIAGLRVVYCPMRRSRTATSSPPWAQVALPGAQQAVQRPGQLRSADAPPPGPPAARDRARPARGRRPRGLALGEARKLRRAFRLRRRLRAQRRAVQSSRRRADAEVLALMDDRRDSALLSEGSAALANAFCVPYMGLMRRLLR